MHVTLLYAANPHLHRFFSAHPTARQSNARPILQCAELAGFENPPLQIHKAARARETPSYSWRPYIRGKNLSRGLSKSGCPICPMVVDERAGWGGVIALFMRKSTMLRLRTGNNLITGGLHWSRLGCIERLVSQLGNGVGNRARYSAQDIRYCMQNA